MNNTVWTCDGTTNGPTANASADLLAETVVEDSDDYVSDIERFADYPEFDHSDRVCSSCGCPATMTVEWGSMYGRCWIDYCDLCGDKALTPYRV